MVFFSRLIESMMLVGLGLAGWVAVMILFFIAVKVGEWVSETYDKLRMTALGMKRRPKDADIAKIRD